MKAQTGTFVISQEKDSTTCKKSFSFITEKFMHLEDSQVWKKFKSGKKDAFTYLYVRYYPVLFNGGIFLKITDKFIHQLYV